MLLRSSFSGEPIMNLTDGNAYYSTQFSTFAHNSPTHHILAGDSLRRRTSGLQVEGPDLARRIEFSVHRWHDRAFCVVPGVQGRTTLTSSGCHRILISVAEVRAHIVHDSGDLIVVQPRVRRFLPAIFSVRHVGRIFLQQEKLPLDDHDRPQSSSANLVTAGALGFFAFTQSRERPDSCHEPFRFDTIPSSPMRHASSKMSGPAAHGLEGLARFAQRSGSVKSPPRHW
jgi:hypothetical protein